MRFFSGRISSSGSGIPFTWRKIFMNSLPVMVSFSIRKSAILSKASRFSERSRFASAYAPFNIRITSTSIYAAVASPQFNTVLPVRYWFSWVARPMSPNFSDIPYWVTMALAILDDQAIPHPRLEVVLTTDEEIGMLGAEALDAAPLRGRKLINVDSEEEGIFTVSCAGGSMAQCTLPVTRAPYDGAVLEVTVRGLTGGHSGTEIHKGRANACVLLGRLLQAMAERTELRLVTAAGGGKDNAIAVEASAQVVVSDDAVARQAAEALAADLSREYAAADPGLRVEAAPCTVRETPMDWASTERAVCMLTCLPNGVQAMSMEIHGLVQTSLNLGILAAEQTALTATFCVRSSLGSQKEMLHRRLRTLMAQLGGTVSISGDYPAWEYRQDSSLRDLMTEVFQEQYGRKPKIEAIHAGVECGILSGKLPGLDCVSIGPNLLDIHTPRERMEIASVQRVWRFVLEVLKRSK